MIIAFAVQQGDLGPGRTALDLGCGTEMLAMGCAVVDCDAPQLIAVLVH
jgi:predicted RNA methylase